MTALHILDVKAFMNLMFSGEAFDSFLFVEGDIATSISYHLEGRVNYSFFTEEELEELKIEEYQSWGATKNIVLQMIKGKKLPVSMKFVLKKSGREEITYLLNIRYDSSNLIIVTGISRASFTLDKFGEKEWDDNVCSFLKKNSICYEVMD